MESSDDQEGPIKSLDCAGPRNTAAHPVGPLRIGVFPVTPGCPGHTSWPGSSQSSLFNPGHLTRERCPKSDMNLQGMRKKAADWCLLLFTSRHAPGCAEWLACSTSEAPLDPRLPTQLGHPRLPEDSHIHQHSNSSPSRWYRPPYTRSISTLSSTSQPNNTRAPLLHHTNVTPNTSQSSRPQSQHSMKQTF
jgi:hypothetical protein